MSKPPKQIKRVGLIANPDKPFSRRAVREAVRVIRELGGEVVLEERTAVLTKEPHPTLNGYAGVASAVDMVAVFGGDGTMLSVAREIGECRTPVIGVNTGRLGFLTAVTLGELEVSLRRVFAGDFTIEKRPMLDGSGVVGGKPFRLVALNDFVVGRGVAPRLIELEVSVDDEMLARYRCDGLIVSTPTGSTAYSLSAGGAIISPRADVIELTPICPHTLSNRSVIVSLKSTVVVKVLNEKPATFVTADGQVQHELEQHAEVRVRHGRSSLMLVQLKGDTFFNTLRRKLNWRGSDV